MPTRRLILAALLVLSIPFAASTLKAQDNISVPLKAEGDVVVHTVQPKPPSEPLRITITFKTTEGGKTTTHRTYTLVSTTNESSLSPKLRDDSQVPVFTGGNMNQWHYQEVQTDVDIRDLKKVGDLVYLALQISTRGITGSPETTREDTQKRSEPHSSPDDKAEGNPNTSSLNIPITHSNSYTVSPTLALGKLTTVYSAIDAVNNTNVEVQVLVQPMPSK
jgi:hypothetical protein